MGRMFRMRHTDPLLAKVCAEQVYDNFLVAAGLMDDSRPMLGRLNDLLLVAIKSGSTDASSTAAVTPEEFSDDSGVNVDDKDKVMEAEIVKPKGKRETTIEKEEAKAREEAKAGK